jgi:threonine dehydrogenase-like Zn-dependent dehydrogenase
MKSAVWTADADLGVREEERPTPGPGEVVLAMRSVRICGSACTASTPRIQAWA